MASPTIGSTSEVSETRPQAGPLPQKRGEIGFQEGVHHAQLANSSSVVHLPARHPADRDLEAGSSSSSSPDQSQDVTAPPLSPSASTEVSSMHKAPKPCLFSWLDPRPFLNQAKLSGIALGTLLRFILQIIILCGTIAGWITLSKLLNKQSNSNPNGPSSRDPASDVPDSSSPGVGSSASIFVHVTFAVATLAQLLFLERCLYLIRAQRYAFTHPGSTLPRHARSAGPVGMGLAPWNRPPLPTYAATLAESGVGTGDVEDNIIAVPPPPPYGNTRGSTLLLSSFMRRSLLGSHVDDGSSDSDNHSTRRPRSISQASQQERRLSSSEEREQRRDAERALQLADTLERLEENSRTARA